MNKFCMDCKIIQMITDNEGLIYFDNQYLYLKVL